MSDLRSPSVLTLANDNWELWLPEIMERSLAFGDAGRIITSGQEVDVHMPDQEDQVEKATSKIFSTQHV